MKTSVPTAPDALLGNNRKLGIAVAVGALLLGVIAAVAFALCTLRIENVTQELLSEEKDLEQAWMDKALTSIRIWRNGLAEKIRFLSSSEMFRLFAADVEALGPDRAVQLFSHDALDSPDENIRSMAEQLQYMRDLLQEVSLRNGWLSASILRENGLPLIAPPASHAADGIDREMKELADRAMKEKKLAFGPLRLQHGQIVTTVADPLYDVLGTDEPQPIAALLLTIPMNDSLASFLSVQDAPRENFHPAILFMDSGTLMAALMQEGKPELRPLEGGAETLPDWPFAKRTSLDAGGEVYSMSGRLLAPDWRMAVEAPAAFVDGRISAQAAQIKGLGFLCSLGAFLILALVLSRIVSSTHKAHARHYKALYSVIRRQKLILDSVNASLQAGLLLTDAHDRIRLRYCNPAFCTLVGHPTSMTSLLEEDGREEDLPGLADILPPQAARELAAGMEKVKKSGTSGALELTIDGGQGPRLYRTTLFPFEKQADEADSAAGGCVAIFQDITDFRRRAKENRRRQVELIQALVRAIESVDANLVGHSAKMERVAEALGAAMDLREKDRETLRLGARLSQVGRIFVPRHLLTKKGALTPEEKREVSRAPEYALGILRNLHFDLPVPEAVSQMNERMDGSGTPHGLKGEEITLAARILGVANAFVAMVSDRSYRKGMPVEEALRRLEADQGLDASVVAALATISPDGLRRLAEGEGAPDIQDMEAL